MPRIRHITPSQRCTGECRGTTTSRYLGLTVVLRQAEVAFFAAASHGWLIDQLPDHSVNELKPGQELGARGPIPSDCGGNEQDQTSLPFLKSHMQKEGTAQGRVGQKLLPTILGDLHGGYRDKPQPAAWGHTN